MAPGADLTAHPPPARIPKLKYRNPLPVDDNPSLQDIPGQIDAQSLDVQEPPTPSIKASSTAYRHSFESGRLTSPSLASVPSSAASSDDSKSSKKKKKTSVFGFLSLKEPSQVALEQFAEAQRKQATDKGPVSPTSPRSSHSGVAQKLPPTVPKVNSKWDGVPESVKKRHSKTIAPNKDRTTSSKRDSSGSAFTTSSKYGAFLSSLKDGAREPPSPTSPSAQNTFLPVRQNSTSKSNRKSTSSSTADIDNDLEQSMTGALPENHRHSRYQAIVVDIPPQSPTYASTSQPVDFRPDSPASDADSVDTVVKDTADVLYKKLNDRPHKSFWEDAPAVQPLEDNDIPESHDFLFEAPTSPVVESPVPYESPPRPVLNFSRPTSSQNYSRSADGSFNTATQRNSALPTLYESSLASVESFGMVHNDDDAYSLAPSTVAPTELSEQWHDSPRERLGLGGHLRMHDVLPWEGQQESGKPKKNRLSIFGKATART